MFGQICRKYDKYKTLSSSRSCFLYQLPSFYNQIVAFLNSKAFVFYNESLKFHFSYEPGFAYVLYSRKTECFDQNPAKTEKQHTSCVGGDDVKDEIEAGGRMTC